MIMKNKKGIVIGIANKYSIAWHTTECLLLEGAIVGACFQNNKIKDKCQNLLKGKEHILDFGVCDLTCEEHIQRLVQKIEDEWGYLDFIVHSVAYSDKSEMTGPYYATSKNNFDKTMHISCWSLTDIVAKTRHLLRPDSSIITFTYEGSHKRIPGYNVMGVAKAALESSVRYLAGDLGPGGQRINCICAGPIKTLSSAVIPGIREAIAEEKDATALKRSVSGEDIGKAAVFLLSDYSKGITGDIIKINNGSHISSPAGLASTIK